MPKLPSRRRRLPETRQSGARNFVCRQNRRTTGWFPSWTAGQMVPWESRNEYHFLLCAEVTPSIASIQAQPLKLQFELDGRVVRYTPDYGLSQGGESLLVEVKPADVASTDEAQAFFAAAGQAAAECGYAYEVVTDTQLKSGYRLANAIEIVRLAVPHEQPDLRARILSDIADGKHVLGEVAPDPNAKRWQLYAMCRRGELIVDHGKPLGPGTNLSFAA